MIDQEPLAKELRTGLTTGACATAATKAALKCLFTRKKVDETHIILPRGEQVIFSIVAYKHAKDYQWVSACVIKDAGDDPDVTHGAEIWVRVEKASKGKGIVFVAGRGVGTVSLAGLPLAIGEPAINPVPRDMMQKIVMTLAQEYQQACDVIIEISIPNGEKIAQKTWNPRLGIVGGLSILGTTGIVQPYSCAAWIHSIKRGIDVARANGYHHLAGATGHMSEKAVQHYYGLADFSLIDMGDFVGGMLHYLARHPVKKITVAGGVGKMVKLAQGALDLHSKRSQVDMHNVALRAKKLGVRDEVITLIRTAPSMAACVELLNDGERDLMYQAIARDALKIVQNIVQNQSCVIHVSILLADRQGRVLMVVEDDEAS